MKTNDDHHQIELEFSRLKHKTWKSYFRLTSFKITLLALLLALNIIFAVIGTFVLSSIPIMGFLVVEITFFTYLVIFHTINLFYVIIFICIATWIRYFLKPDPIGLMTLNIDDVFMICVYAIFFNLFTFFVKFKKINKETKQSKYIIVIFTFLISMIIVAFMNTFIVWLFVLDLYKKFYQLNLNKNNITLLAILYGFNILKYSINLLIYLPIIEPLNKIKSNSIFIN